MPWAVVLCQNDDAPKLAGGVFFRYKTAEKVRAKLDGAGMPVVLRGNKFHLAQFRLQWVRWRDLRPSRHQAS